MDVFSQIAGLEKPTATGNLRQQIVDLLCEMGESLGFTVLVNQDVACEWIMDKQRIAIEVQFGNADEYYKSLRALVLSGASHCVLIISSKSRSLSIQQAQQMLGEKFSTTQKQFLIFDIETKQKILVGQPEKKPEAKAMQNAQNLQKQNQTKNPLHQDGLAQGQWPSGRGFQGQRGKPNASSFLPDKNSSMLRGQRRKMIYGKKGEHKKQD